MPTYSYKCKDCSYEFDIRQKMTDEKLIECPECDKETLRKVIKPSGITLKGSGWTGKLG